MIFLFIQCVSDRAAGVPLLVVDSHRVWQQSGSHHPDVPQDQEVKDELLHHAPCLG